MCPIYERNFMNVACVWRFDVGTEMRGSLPPPHPARQPICSHVGVATMPKTRISAPVTQKKPQHGDDGALTQF